MGNILFSTDLSKESEQALVRTVRLARELERGIVLLHVVHELVFVPNGVLLMDDDMPPDIDDEVNEARAALQALAHDIVRDIGAEVKTEVITSTDIAAAIASFAKSVNAELIALSTHGRTGIRRLLMGSIAEGVMRHASTPILCFPLKGESAWQGAPSRVQVRAPFE